MRESDYVLMTVIHEVLVNSDEATTLLGVIFVIGLVTTGLWRVADQFIPTSKKLQETPLPLKESSPWHSHGLSQEDYSSQSRRLNSLSEKLLSDGRLIIKYLRIYWSPYWLPSVISALCLMIKPAYQLLFAQQLGVIIDNGVSIMVSSALALGGSCRSSMDLLYWVSVCLLVYPIGLRMISATICSVTYRHSHRVFISSPDQEI